MFCQKTHFFQFVPGCIDADFCDQIRVEKLLTRSTNYLRVNTITRKSITREFVFTRTKPFPRITRTPR